jgi:hypothetical protein
LDFVFDRDISADIYVKVLLGNSQSLGSPPKETTAGVSPYLLEKVSLEFLINLSIVPSAANLARFKILGSLPQLHANFSDEKYKSLMRIVTAIVPKFDELKQHEIQGPTNRAAKPDRLKLQGNLFGEQDYQLSEASSSNASALHDIQDVSCTISDPVI